MSEKIVETIGKLLDADQKRDAIHMAIAPVIAARALSPGEHVCIRGGKAFNAGPSSSIRAIGIVDPFLTESVLPGERFWLFLYPGSIKGLRHDWSHPDLEDEGEDEGLEPHESTEDDGDAWCRTSC